MINGSPSADADPVTLAERGADNRKGITMNRAERRQVARRERKIEKTAKRVMTQYELGYAEGLKAGKNQAMFELAGQCSRTFTTAIVAVIRSEWKFGKVRIERMLKMLYAQLEDMLNGRIAIQRHIAVKRALNVKPNGWKVRLMNE